jgi:hypothetical protein
MPRIIDLKKECKQLYNPPAKMAVIITVPQMNFLMIDGKGDPGKAGAFQQAIEALYSLAYTIKFMNKKTKGAVDYTVMPLEGLWWADKMEAFTFQKRDSWKWTLMIMQPEFINAAMVQEATAAAAKKKDFPSLKQIRFEKFTEGSAAQIMHVGPFSSEEPTIGRLHSFIAESDHTRHGKHHEIYLSDFRRVAPEKMKTVLRQPIKMKVE